MEFTRNVTLGAFQRDSRRQRQYLRIINRVLALAKERGFSNSERFLKYFNHSDDYDPKMTKYWLASLCEYVSVEEFSQLAQIRT